MIVLGVLLAGWAVSELWFAVIRRRAPRAGVEPPEAEPGTIWAGRVLMGAFLVVAAVLMLLDRVDLTIIIGAVVILRAALMVVRAVRAPAGKRRDPLIAAALLTGTGVVVIITPETAVLAMRAGIGVGAMALGGVMLSMGLRRGDTDIRQRFDHSSAPALVNDWLVRRRLSPEEPVPWWRRCSSSHRIELRSRRRSG